MGPYLYLPYFGMAYNGYRKISDFSGLQKVGIWTADDNSASFFLVFWDQRTVILQFMVYIYIYIYILYTLVSQGYILNSLEGMVSDSREAKQERLRRRSGRMQRGGGARQQFGIAVALNRDVEYMYICVYTLLPYVCKYVCILHICIYIYIYRNTYRHLPMSLGVGLRRSSSRVWELTEAAFF